ncbi:MAG: hybrid sensor histidine kinase/response regulator [Cyanobacteria bacterium P01_A01_bin.116]
MLTSDPSTFPQSQLTSHPLSLPATSSACLAEDESPRILIVDDNPTNLKVLTDAIRGRGFTTLVANDGTSAIAQIEYSHPHLILLDVMMPGLDGFETCQRLKANPKTQAIPIIFMTALSDTVDRVKGLSLGAVDYITKPFQPEEVIARVTLHLQLSLLTQKLAHKNAALEEKIVEKEAAESQLQALNASLEQHVQERTAQLSTSLQQLQETQLRLIQSEKMSALGQLVAGVGNEISTPVCVISGNLDCIQGYIEGLLEYITLQQADNEDPSPAVLKKANSIELDYIIEDLPKLMAAMRQGTERIEDISASLGTLSRGENPSQIAYSLHECLESGLLLLQHRIGANDQRPAVRIAKHYGYLPAVKCYPGQLTQVFMNLLANALDVFDAASVGSNYTELEKHPHAITLKSYIDEANHQVVVSVANNGPSIPETLKANLFKPLYPTGSLKPSSKQTGLGLAICKHIVEENHQGYLTYDSGFDDSDPNKGVVFVITLPIEGADRRG